VTVGGGQAGEKKENEGGALSQLSGQYSFSCHDTTLGACSTFSLKSHTRVPAG
jgi:hypothetical protein